MRDFVFGQNFRSTVEADLHLIMAKAPRKGDAAIAK